MAANFQNESRVAAPHTLSRGVYCPSEPILPTPFAVHAIERPMGRYAILWRRGQVTERSQILFNSFVLNNIEVYERWSADTFAAGGFLPAGVTFCISVHLGCTWAYSISPATDTALCPSAHCSKPSGAWHLPRIGARGSAAAAVHAPASSYGCSENRRLAATGLDTLRL